MAVQQSCSEVVGLDVDTVMVWTKVQTALVGWKRRVSLLKAVVPKRARALLGMRLESMNPMASVREQAVMEWVVAAVLGGLMPMWEALVPAQAFPR